jgi:divalent metal cation (Fe/Co/Zn/Cd) transporter
MGQGDLYRRGLLDGLMLVKPSRARDVKDVTHCLARESKSLLMGEPAYPFIRKSILSIANSHSGCLRANGLITVQLGPDQIVAMLSLEFADTMLAPDIEEVVIGLEKSLREANPEIVALFVKPQTAKTYQEQRDRALNGSD